MSEEKLYTFSEVLERLMLTDEELLLCKQHKEYGKRLDEILEFDSERMDIVGQNGNDGLHYSADTEGNIRNWHGRNVRTLGIKLGPPPE